MRRLSLQEPIGALNARLEADHPATFAGLTIEHEPSFQVVARFTRGADEALRGALTDPRLAAVARAERAAVPLRVLQTRLEAAHARVRERGIAATGGLNLRENRPEIYVLAPHAAAARAALPAESGAAVVVVEELPKEELALYGGLPLSTCTSGFTVQNSSGTKGITTAGHCGNSQSYAGYSLTFLSEYDAGSYDIQWHNRSGSTYENKIQAGSGFRSITGTRTRANQVVGEWICKQGKTTGWTCGTLSNKSYCFDGACTWMYVDGGSVNLSEGGDSGGPWVNGEVAYGSHVFGGGNNSGYMAIDYLSGIGVTVVTSSPPTASITGPTSISSTGTYTWHANAAGGNGSYTYQWAYRVQGTSTWTNVGTASSYSRSVANTDASFELRVIVTSAGLTGSDTHLVTVSSSQPPTASITGPSTILTAGTYTWHSNAAGGTGTYTYQWQYRTQGSTTWSNVGTASSYSRSVGQYSLSFELRVIVTSGGLTGSDTHLVDVFIEPMCGDVYC